MSLEYFITYFLIVSIAIITPGPNTLLAINHGVNHGIEKSMYSGLGNGIGNLLMALVSILGLGAILVASGVVFNLIKWAGILYLVYLGGSLIISPVQTEGQNEPSKDGRAPKSGWRLFLDGLLIAIGNPKGIVFFTALFPQFIDTKTASISDFLIVFSTLVVLGFACYMLYAVSGVRLNKLFRKLSFRKAFNRISGSIFIGVGIALTLSKK